MINKDFFSALDELEKERKINKELFIESLEAGLVSAYKRETGEARNITVTLNPQRALIKVYAYQTVVAEVEDPEKEISLEDARLSKPECEVGDRIMEDVTPKNFSRIAAQTAKQVINQRLNDYKKSMVITEMSEREGEIMNAKIRRVEGDNVYVEIVNTQLEGILMSNDKIKDENYQVNDVIKVYIKNIRTTARGSQVVVSRSVAGFVKRLFELEVPEIRMGLVQVRGIVRDAGYRTKMAVSSDNEEIDAVGACIGQKGVRINAVVSELNGEKVDIISYSSDPSEYIAKALSPAKVLMVQVNEEEKTARVVVPDDKLSLAIGKGGQNVRLAAKLTGWKIDVKSVSAVSLNVEELLENNYAEEE